MMSANFCWRGSGGSGILNFLIFCKVNLFIAAHHICKTNVLNVFSSFKKYVRKYSFNSFLFGLSKAKLESILNS